MAQQARACTAHTEDLNSVPSLPYLEYLNTYNSSSRGIQCIWHLGTPTFACTFNLHRHIDTKLKINFKTLQSNVKARVHVRKSEGVL